MIAPKAVMDKLASELVLSPEQRGSMERIVCTAHKRFFRLRRRHQPELQNIVIDSIADMKSFLNPAQQTIADRLLDEEVKRWAAEDKRIMDNYRESPCSMDLPVD